MINEAYNLYPSKDNTFFLFESDGPQGKITKIIEFARIDDNIWNLGFGDWQKEGISDTVISNNQDIVKVMNTVAQTVYIFLNQYPDSIILIKPVDEKRSRLYNTIFQRHLKDIELSFDVKGYIKDVIEPYSPLKIYDVLQIKLKD
jgi:hypothetical protein